MSGVLDGRELESHDDPVFYRLQLPCLRQHRLIRNTPERVQYLPSIFQKVNLMQSIALSCSDRVRQLIPRT